MLRTLSSVRFVFCCAVRCPRPARVHMASDPDVCQSSRFICQEDIDACEHVSRSARGDGCTQPTSQRFTCSRAYEHSEGTHTHVQPYIPLQSLLPSFHGKADGRIREMLDYTSLYTEYCCTWKSPCLLVRLCKQLVHFAKTLSLFFDSAGHRRGVQPLLLVSHPAPEYSWHRTQ
jgi:hypothetical protein